ncbi:MAG: CAP domain-containing protein [Nanoarchaeota archaeon]|nr:CAP domain-containing protein [Nanoarchaeota archaeon]
MRKIIAVSAIFIFVFQIWIASASVESDFLNLVNEERAKLGRGVLTYNDKLTKAGVLHAEDMIDKNYFSHTSIDGRSFVQRINEQGYGYSAIGENIAYHSGTPSASKVFSMWKNSPGHYSNMISSKYTEMGLGVVYDGRRTIYVQDLGTGRTNTLPPINSGSNSSKPPIGIPPRPPLTPPTNEGKPKVELGEIDVNFNVSEKLFRNYKRVVVKGYLGERTNIISHFDGDDKRICVGCRKFARSYKLGLDETLSITYLVYFRARNLTEEYDFVLG